MAYSPKADFDVALPSDDEQRENLLEKLNNHKVDEVGYNPALSGDFDLDEIYVDTSNNNKQIRLSGVIDGLFISGQIPLYANDQLKKFARDLADAAGVSVFDGSS